MNGASGCLAITSEGRRGMLYFETGRIVNAIDDSRVEGEEGAYKLFTWKRGRFEFRAEPFTGHGLIEVSTEALMLEAARRMDEAGGAEGSPGGEAEKLLEHQQAFGALREVFQNLASEARAADAVIGRAAATDLAALKRADDLLLLRPNHPARLRLHGAWRIGRAAAVDAAEYSHIRARLFGEVADPPRFAEVELSGNRRVHVSRLGEGTHEALWVRPSALPAPAAAHLIAPPDQMALLASASSGLVLVASSDPAVASRVLHALVGARLQHVPETVLVSADPPIYRHKDGAGVLLDTTPGDLRTALELASPETLALDVVTVVPGSLSRRLGPVRMIIARVAGEAGPTMLDQWRQSLDPVDRTTVDGWLQSQNVVLVAAHRPGPDESTLPFNAWTSGASMPVPQNVRG
jgi:hypothetical protein